MPFGSKLHFPLSLYNYYFSLFIRGEKNQKHYINTFVKGTHFTSNIVCRQESPSCWPDLSLSPEPSHLHELLRWLRPGLPAHRGPSLGGGETTAEGGLRGRGARRPSPVFPAALRAEAGLRAAASWRPALFWLSIRCSAQSWQTLPAAWMAFCTQAPCKGAALDTRLLPTTALSAHWLCGLRGAPRPGWGSILRTLGPPHLSTSGLQRRMAVSACVMGAWVAPNSCQVSCLMLSGHN